MPLPRFRIRTIMIVVALVAVAIAIRIEVRRLHRLSSTYRWKALLAKEDANTLKQIAKVQDRAASNLEKKLVAINKDYNRLSDPGGIKATRDNTLRRAEWNLRLAEKYERAARYPWVPVAPDTPEPE